MFSEIFNMFAQVGIYPVLAVLWYKMDRADRAQTALLAFLEKTCPNCGAVRVRLK